MGNDNAGGIEFLLYPVNEVIDINRSSRVQAGSGLIVQMILGRRIKVRAIPILFSGLLKVSEAFDLLFATGPPHPAWFLWYWSLLLWINVWRFLTRGNSRFPHRHTIIQATVLKRKTNLQPEFHQFFGA